MLSIIVPAYNSEKTISSCIESILRQDISDYEIVVVNDGSTDKTKDILEKLEKKVENMHVFHIPNGGVSHARNFGVKHSAGELIFFLDSDDYLDRSCLRKLMDSYSKNHADITAAEIRDEEGTSLAAKYWFSQMSSFFVADVASMGQNMMYTRMGSAVGKLFKKSIIDDYNINFEEDVALAEDLIFVHKYILQCHSIEKNHEASYIVRNINDNSLSKRYVANIEPCIDKQCSIMKEVFSAYPEYEKEWYKYTMDIDASGCIMYSKNLFLDGCPLTLRQKYIKLREYLIKESHIDSVRHMKTNAGPKNAIDKIQCAIIQLGNIPLIMLFYSMKEAGKKVSRKSHMWRK